MAPARTTQASTNRRIWCAAAIAFLVATAACAPTIRHRAWEIRIFGTADSVMGAYIASDTKGAESHSIRDALPVHRTVTASVVSVGARNGSAAGDSLHIEIWEGGKLRRQVSTHRSGELISVVSTGL